MWTATWALNTLVAKGKPGDWMVHMMGQAVGGFTNATHGMTLAAVSLPYYRYIMPYGLAKFVRLQRTYGMSALMERVMKKSPLKVCRRWNPG